MARLALLSVSDKTGIVDLAKSLVNDFGFEIISSGGTANTLKEAGIPVMKVSDYTGSPEILGGRVKTLHPRIHGGILSRRDVEQDLADLADNDIRPIDLVVVNLYPFEQTIAKPDVTLPNAIEKIDIGGPTLLRASAKNFAHLTVLCEPGQYDPYLTELKANGGDASLAFRQAASQKAFWQTASYDQAIATYLSQHQPETDSAQERFATSGQLIQPLRYGENPHQAAGWYQTGTIPSGWTAAQKLQGKDLSYNNLMDLEAARQIIAEFPSDQPAAAVLKHTNPCGMAMGRTLVDAYEKAYAADSISAFGGIVALNQDIDAATATAMTQTFLECVVAPGCTDEAQEILAAKANLRVLILADATVGPAQTVKAIAGGLLIQNSDDQPINFDEWTVATEKQPTEAQLAELAFAWKAVKHVKSNAIVVTRDRTTLGIGAGQMNRVGAANNCSRAGGRESQTGPC